MYTIDKDVPIPPPRSTYPFRDMKVGNSFLVPLERQKSARSSTWQFQRKSGAWKFSSRLERDKKGKAIGLRVYRIA